METHCSTLALSALVTLLYMLRSLWITPVYHLMVNEYIYIFIALACMSFGWLIALLKAEDNPRILYKGKNLCCLDTDNYWGIKF